MKMKCGCSFINDLSGRHMNKKAKKPGDLAICPKHGDVRVAKSPKPRRTRMAETPVAKLKSIVQQLRTGCDDKKLIELYRLVESMDDGPAPFFDFSEENENMWRNELESAMESQKVVFGFENEETVGQRVVEYPDLTRGHGLTLDRFRLRAELRSDGGDWEHPVHYFRAQLFCVSPYGEYGLGKFVYIPTDVEGNALHRVTAEQLGRKKPGEWLASYGCDELDEGAEGSESDDAPAVDEAKMWAAIEAQGREYIKSVIEGGKRPFRAKGSLHARSE